MSHRFVSALGLGVGLVALATVCHGSVPAAPVFTSANPVQTLVVGESSSFVATASGSPTFTASSLPSGLSMTSAGAISGSATAVGSWLATITATNAGGSATQTLVMVVTYPVVSVTNFASDGTGAPRSYSMPTGSNCVTIIAWGAVGFVVASYDDVPSDSFTIHLAGGQGGNTMLQLAPGTVHIAGGPGICTAGGTAYNTLTIPDSSGPTSPGVGNKYIGYITIIACGKVAPPVFTSSGSTQTPVVGKPFSFTVTGTNSPTITATSLPPGLTINSSGVISGTPTSAGSWSSSLTASNGGGTASQTLPFVVYPQPAISSVLSLTDPMNHALSYTITASGSPTSFAASGLPPGVTVNSSTGVISGTPTTPGSYPVTITASNAGASGSATLTLVVQQTYTLTITDAPVAGGTATGAGTYVTGTSVAIQETANTGFTASGWGGADGGSVTAPSNSSSTIVMSANRVLAANFTPITPTFTSGTATQLPIVGHSFSDTVTATPAATFTASGLPPGLTISSSGTITGTATGVGSWSATITANNNGATATESLPFAVYAQPVVTSALTDSGKLNEPFTYTATASGTPTGFSATNLPPGLTIDPTTGVISGTPTAAGPYLVVVTAANPGTSGSATLHLTILQTYTLTITNQSGGTSTGGGIYDPGTSVAITETANDHFRTAGWGGADGSAVSNSASASTTVVMSANRALTADFVAQGVLTVLAGPGGTASGNGTFDVGSVQAVVATPADGSVFTGWTGTGISDDNAALTTVAISGDMTVNAAFETAAPTLLGTLQFPNAVATGQAGITPTTTTLQAVFTNSGSSPETITDLTTTGEFQPTIGLPVTIPAGGSTSVTLTFAPTALGSFSGVVVALTDSASTPVLEYDLLGTGVNPNSPPSAVIVAPPTAYTLSPLTVRSTAMAPDNNLTLHSIEWLASSGAWTVNAASASGGNSARTLGITFPSTGVWTVRAGASVDNGTTWYYSPNVQITVSDGITQNTLQTMAVPVSNQTNWYTASPVAQKIYQVKHINP